MESDVFYAAIKTNDHFYDFQPYNQLFVALEESHRAVDLTKLYGRERLIIGTRCGRERSVKMCEQLKNLKGFKSWE